MQRSVTRKQLIKLITHSSFEFSAKKRNSNETNVIVGCYCAVEGLVPSVSPSGFIVVSSKRPAFLAEPAPTFPCAQPAAHELPVRRWGSVLWQHWWQILPQRVFQRRKHLVMQGPTLRSMAAVLAECRLSLLRRGGWLTPLAWHGIQWSGCVGPLGDESPGPWPTLPIWQRQTAAFSLPFISPASFLQRAGLIIVTYLVCALVH